jgi:tetratricopeptide (TPR) repeat protein
LVLALCACPAFAADKVAGSAQSGYRRLAFTLDSPAKITATATGAVLAIAFDRKPSLDVAAFVAAAPGLIASGHADADGKTLRFALSQPVKLHTSQQGLAAVVDLAPTDFTGAMPDLAPPPKPLAPKPVDPANLPEIKLRAGTYSNFTRLVFDWGKDVPYTVFPGAGKLTVKFAVPARMDLSILTKFPPAWVKSASWHQDGGTTSVEITTDSDSGFHDFRDGNHVVLDILAPKTDAAAYAPPGTAKPQVTKMAAGVSAAQAKAVTDAAATLAGKKPADIKTPAPADPKAAAAKPDANKTAGVKPDVKNAGAKTVVTRIAEAKPAESTNAKPAETTDASAAAMPNAVGQLTKAGASLSFRGAGAAAVFVRGLTAWIVLENAPTLDAALLQKSLNGFATTVEAAVNPGLTVLRIGLKSPAKIAAHSEGQSLRVTIGGDVASDATAIGFARNQADPRRTSLTTTLPRADKAFSLTDPASGDSMTVVPSAAGYAVPAQKIFADFAALPSAQGLVIAPYTDDLSVTVGQARVTIARPNGMALTPPQAPVASSPAALAHIAGGPSYLDFAKWGQPVAGSILATQRALNHDIAVVPPTQMNNARLRLARFYLAQGFGAEALGLVNLIQSTDPALKGDIQLSTMRAAADVQMGRYRDAHNELAGPLFDNDRHAAFWRGLADAGLENWKDAHSELEAADAVMSRYPEGWRARAILADARAALELSRLDLADAALLRLPKTLPKPMEMEARLGRARIAAAEGRYDAAVPEFTAVEKSGDERLEAAAIYYHTEAALNAGALQPKQAIGALERLRYRWRGDGLELKTLRKLASLYFKGNDWQDGLKTLRVATQNFTGDAARAAQDDMRGAFISLYLKGGADKLSPVQSLAMFYENIDLTPIGTDGDEMIRRMADRLIAVDLLSPATTLLAYQVDKRLEGVAKAQVATRLAAVQVMDAKPADAISTLRNSEITGLPEDIVHGRLILEARAFAALKQYDNALDLIAVDDSPETRQLRVDIYWESGNWAVAGQKIEEMLVSQAASPAALTGPERMDVLRAAIAYSLANDEKSLERLGTSFTSKMNATPDANLFAVLIQPIDMHGLAFRDAAAKIASVDTLKSFMADFQKKFAAPAPAKAS